LTDKSQTPVIYIDSPRHPDLQTLFQYWSAKRGTRAMPARADINPADIKPLLPDVMIWSAVEPFPIRLVGDHIVRFVGGNNTGKPATDGMPPNAAAAMLGVIMDVIAAKAPRFRLGKAFWLPEKEYRMFEAAYLPLSTDGMAVDMILGGIKFDVPA
jgi:hypothetical protein